MLQQKDLIDNVDIQLVYGFLRKSFSSRSKLVLSDHIERKNVKLNTFLYFLDQFLYNYF